MFKLISYGSSIGNSGLAGSGGHIRDHNGLWIIGYCRSVDNVLSELNLDLRY